MAIKRRARSMYGLSGFTWPEFIGVVLCTLGALALAASAFWGVWH